MFPQVMYKKGSHAKKIPKHYPGVGWKAPKIHVKKQILFNAF